MTSTDTLTFRAAVRDDAPELLKIYAPYVENTAISFEYDVPSEAEFQKRILHTLERYPYIIAELNGQIAGYAYASAFKTRVAYDYAAETTIYLREDMQGQGIGRKLYSLLEHVLRAQGVCNACACIGYTPRANDPHLTNASPAFHEHMNYRLVGRFYECGYKFGMWYDMIWMEKHLAQHCDTPMPLRAFNAVKAEFGL